MDNQKEAIFAFNEDTEEMPILLSSGLLNPNVIGLSWRVILNISIIYTLIWSVLYYIVFNKKIIKSVIYGYLFGLIIFIAGELVYKSPYWIVQNEKTNEFNQYYSTMPYMVMSKNNYFINKNDKYTGFIIDKKVFEKDTKINNIKTQSYGEYSRTHNISSKFNNEPGLRGTFPLGVDTAFKLVVIIISIGILVSDRSKSRFSIVLPWIIYVVIFSILQETVWIWNSFTYSFENELWLKNFLLLIAYSLSITVILITINN